MSHIESRNQDTIEVDYKGHTIEIPSQHNWIAVVNQTSPVDGLMKSYLASFSKKPILSRKGNFMNQPGDDYTLLVEVNPVDDVAGTLQQVQGKPEGKYAALNAAAFKLAEDILVKQNGDDSETKVFHDIYCPDHGLLGDFFQAHQNTLREIFNVEDDEDEDEDEIPEEFKQLLGVLGLLGLLGALKKGS